MTAAAEMPYVGSAAPAARPLRVGVTPVARRRPALELVAAARRDAPRAPFVAVVVSILVAGLLGLLVLNTALAKDSFAVHTLSQDGRALADREQSLSREVEALRSPQALAAKAAELGMVQAGPPAFLRLPDGAVLGAAGPAVLPEGEPAPDADTTTAADAPVDAPADAPVDVNNDGIAGNDTTDADAPVDVNNDGIAGNDIPAGNHTPAGNDTSAGGDR